MPIPLPTTFGKRIDFINKTMREEFSLEPIHIEPLDFDHDTLFPYNNFVYRLELRCVVGTNHTTKTSKPQPGATPLPPNFTTLAIRLNNPRALLNDTNRVENEVAMMSLARDALKYIPNKLVPEIYGWGSAATGQGWILQQYMPGKKLDLVLRTLQLKDKKPILRQIAEIIKALQNYQLPETIPGYGGLSFDVSGNIVSAQMTLLRGGPYPTYQAYYKALLQAHLDEADKNAVILGWEANGVRKRLDKFIAEKLDSIIQNCGPNKKTLVHGDFNANNLLVDPRTHRLTALLDFDWAHIAWASDEFFRSFKSMDGQFSGPCFNDSDTQILRNCFIRGFPDPLPDHSCEIGWEFAKAWDDELARMRARKPSNMRGFVALADLHWLHNQITPYFLCNPTILQYRKKQDLETDRKEAEEWLVWFLNSNGY